MKIKDMTHAQLLAYHRNKQRGYREEKARKRLEWKALGLIPPREKRKDAPTRTCKRCNKTLPNTKENFNIAKTGYSENMCKPCAARRGRARVVAKKYGLKLEEYETLFEDATCAICGDSGRLVLDHCHELNILRGVLCHPCNVMLGLARDDVIVLQAAIDYLRK